VLHEICESHGWSFDTLRVWLEKSICVCVCETDKGGEREREISIAQPKLIEKCDNNLMLICADKNVITLLVISGKKKLVYQLCFRVCGRSASTTKSNVFLPVMAAAKDATPIRYTPTRLGADYHRSQPLLTTEVYIQTTKLNAFLPVMVAATDTTPIRYTPTCLGADYRHSQPLLTTEVYITLQLTTA